MAGEFYYVYVLRSLTAPERRYTGATGNLESRLRAHNCGRCPHTAKHVPWKIEIAVAFRCKERAVAFEKYLKSHSGRAFAKRHF